MKLFLLSIVLVHSLLSFDYKLKPQAIDTTNVYCFFGLAEVMDKHNNGNMVNSCFVNLGSTYLVIDSGPTYLYAKQAYSAMKKIKNIPVSYVINTHVHDDHWLGNSFYKIIGAKIIGSSAFKELAIVEKTRMQRRISPQAYKLTQQILPEIFVDEETILYQDGKKIYINSVNTKAHTDSDLYVYIPSLKIAFVGDLVFNQRLPSLRDGNIIGWISILKKLKKLDVNYIVGGHGNLITKESIDFTYIYLTTLQQRVQKLLDEGDDIPDVVNKVTMSKYKNIPFYDSIHRQNVEIVYRMLEWGSE